MCWVAALRSGVQCRLMFPQPHFKALTAHKSHRNTTGSCGYWWKWWVGSQKSSPLQSRCTSLGATWIEGLLANKFWQASGEVSVFWGKTSGPRTCKWPVTRAFPFALCSSEAEGMWRGTLSSFSPCQQDVKGT